MKKRLSEWTKKEFMELPINDWNKDIGDFTSLVIIPTNKIHDSGFMCMDFVAVKGEDPICRLSGCSDVIHINGVGGFGLNLAALQNIPHSLPPVGWSIDCLKKSKLLRLFCEKPIRAGNALSSFEVFSSEYKTK